MRPALAALALVAFNIVVSLLPIDYSVLGNYAFFGVFLVTAIANATTIVPVPYIPIVACIAQQSNLFGLIIPAGALGSMLGESVAFFVGRSGRDVIDDTRFYRWVQRQLLKPWRAFLVLFLLAAPPNPLFDIAGLTAGALGLPYWLFATAVFLGRLIRIGLIVLYRHTLCLAG